MTRVSKIVLGSLLSLFLALAIGVPLLASAANAFAPYWGPIVSCSSCNSWCDVMQTIQNLSRFIMTVAIFAAMPGMFAVGAFMIMGSGTAESSNLLKRGSATCKWAVLGGVITLGAYVILNTMLWILGNPSTGGISWPNIVCI